MKHISIWSTTSRPALVPFASAVVLRSRLSRPDDQGLSPLGVAVSRDNDEIIKLLLQQQLSWLKKQQSDMETDGYDGFFRVRPRRRSFTLRRKHLQCEEVE